ncbi:FAD-dependent thiol oxidase [Pyrrhoderma noxium]|uniref:Cytochrome c oxidase assembly protein COX16, mitochondrial n=1 Tax=Pyrrhoderma noxium TaxID=2282107 RepID=A0A286UW35_9AGAM|nr:FAD-dependent thiol oxidase [Pyrrhoderma noxium]
MPSLPSNPLNQSPLNGRIRKNPLLFGIPFVMIIVGASFAMTAFTQTRYDLQSQRRSNISKEEELGLKKNRKKIDIREEYYRIQSAANEDWEPKRVERPKGVPEWGVAPSEPSTPPRNAEINRR